MSVVTASWEAVPCDVCGSHEYELLGSRNFVIRQKTFEFALHCDDALCKACGFVYSARRPPLDFVERYYADAHDLYEGETDIAVDYDSDLRIALIKRYVASGATVLEIGAGKGHFCKALTLAGYKATGLDPKEQESDVRRHFIGESGADAAEGCDAVVSYYVGEHLSKPGQWLQQVGSSLKKHGYLILEVPNFASHPLESLLHEHFLHFTEVHLRALLMRYGFDVIHASSKASRYFGFVVVARLADPALLRDPAPVHIAFDVAAVKEGARQTYKRAQAELAGHEAVADTVAKKVMAMRAADPSLTVIFWAANVYSSLIGVRLDTPDWVVVVDNAASKLGKRHEGFGSPVVSPSALTLSGPGRKLVIICSPAWNESIRNQITAMGLIGCIIIDGTTGAELA